jgi:hypothetical protein
MIVPLTGEIWQHEKSGTNYRVVRYAAMEATGAPVVVYERESYGAVVVPPADRQTWVRPLAEFLDRFRHWEAAP